MFLCAFSKLDLFQGLGLHHTGPPSLYSLPPDHVSEGEGCRELIHPVCYYFRLVFRNSKTKERLK